MSQSESLGSDGYVSGFGTGTTIIDDKIILLIDDVENLVLIIEEDEIIVTLEEV